MGSVSQPQCDYGGEYPPGLGPSRQALPRLGGGGPDAAFPAPPEPQRAAGRSGAPARRRLHRPGTEEGAADIHADFIAICPRGHRLAALFVILSQQSTRCRRWFPFLGEDRFELKTEFQTAQAVTPGQGQTATSPASRSAT